jgi:hypothetical protein
VQEGSSPVATPLQLPVTPMDPPETTSTPMEISVHSYSPTVRQTLRPH